MIAPRRAKLDFQGRRRVRRVRGSAKICQKKLKKKTLLLLVLSFCSGVMLNAQVTADASLTGVIRDSSGGVIPNAQVKLESKASGSVRETLSDSQGQYRFDLVAPGTYKETVTVTGFLTKVMDNLAL